MGTCSSGKGRTGGGGAGGGAGGGGNNTKKFRHKAKINDYEIMTDGKSYYVKFFWDADDNTIYKSSSFQDADRFISNIYGMKPGLGLAKQQKKKKKSK